MDPTPTPLPSPSLRGYSKLNPSRDSRLPISLPILENIILASEHTKSSLYSRKLTQVICAVAFFAAALELVKLLFGAINPVKILLVSVKLHL